MFGEIDEVHASGVSLLITKDGKPYVILEPFYGKAIPESGGAGQG
jgi:hypothetical protein